MSVFDCRMIGTFPTTRQPMRGFVDKIKALEGKDRVLSISVAHCFPYADVPEIGTKIVVVTDDRADFGARLAETLGRELYAMRGKTAPPYLSIDDGITKALANNQAKPVVCADPADNAGGGAPSDSTQLLRRMIERGVEDAAIGPIWDPIAVRFCFGAGEGARLRLRFGGKTAPSSGQPIDAEVEVIRTVHDAQQSFGNATVNMGDAASIRARDPSASGFQSRPVHQSRHRSREEADDRGEIDKPFPRGFRANRRRGSLYRHRRPDPPRFPRGSVHARAPADLAAGRGRTQGMKAGKLFPLAASRGAAAWAGGRKQFPMSRQTLGMLSVAAGVSVFTIQDVIVKEFSGLYPVHQIVVIRSLVALPLLFVATIAGQGGSLRIHRVGLHVLRGILLYISYISYFLALAQLPMATSVALYFTVPFFVATLAVPILGERVRGRSWVAIGVGFLGALIIIRPGAGVIEPASLLPIVSALAYSISALLARRLGTTDGGAAMALTVTAIYFVAGAITALALAGMPPSEDAHRSVRFLLNPWIWPSFLDTCLLSLCGVIAAAGFFFLSQGYRLAEVNRAAPFEYAALPWSILWGYLFFGNLPDAAMLLGAAVIMSAGFYTLHSERREAR
jgi:drug/metabolite transporter (DMT)-like permease